MSQIRISLRRDSAPLSAPFLVVLAGREGGKNGKRIRLPRLPARESREAERAMEGGFFKGEPGEVVALPIGDRQALILAGLGSDGRWTADRFRAAAGAASRKIRALKGAKGEIRWPSGLLSDAGMEVRAVAEGAILGLYTCTRYKSKPSQPSPLRELILAGGDGRAEREGLRVGKAMAEAQCFARDLAQGPANVMTPVATAREACRWARSKGVRCRVLGESQLRRMGFGALLGVGQGSENETQLLVLEHNLRAGKRPLAFVGKGVTFDTGGISIKPASGMHEMKGDMQGGAAVIAAVGACADLKIPHPVVGLVPFVENMPGGNAQRPGDIVRSLSGLTIEVLNTDAEGRLALADALAYAKRYKPAAIVDIATLTGSCAVALGKPGSGLFTEDEDLSRLIGAAACRTGESVWRLPIWDEMKTSMDSDIADLKNLGSREGGAISAAVFLSKFAEGERWAHVDMAGPSWSEGSPLSIKGPTGYGARLLAQVALDWSSQKA